MKSIPIKSINAMNDLATSPMKWPLTDLFRASAPPSTVRGWGPPLVTMLQPRLSSLDWGEVTRGWAEEQRTSRHWTADTRRQRRHGEYSQPRGHTSTEYFPAFVSARHSVLLSCSVCISISYFCNGRLLKITITKLISTENGGKLRNYRNKVVACNISFNQYHMYRIKRTFNKGFRL